MTTYGDKVYAENNKELTANPKQAAVTDSTAANAANQTAAYVLADVQSIATLANELKTKVNAILAALRAAGIIA